MRPTEPEPEFSNISICKYILAAAATVVLPLAISESPLPVLPRYMPTARMFRLFGLCGAVFLLAFGWTRFRAAPRFLRARLPVLLQLLVGFVFLSLITEFLGDRQSRELFDYKVYEEAGQAVLREQNPYEMRQPYIYPPFLAQVMAAAYALADRSLRMAGPGLQEEQQRWNLIYYFYQCAQFWLILLAQFLLCTMARQFGLGGVSAALLAGALVLCNNPLQATLVLGQINLWVLNSILLAVVLAARRPFLSGAALAVGAHLKMYPLFLLVAWAFSRRWRLLIASLTAAGIIVLVQTGLVRDFRLWQQFFQYLAAPQRPTDYMNNSVYSLLANSLHFLGALTGLALDDAGGIVTAAVSLVITGWFAIRSLQREKFHRRLTQNGRSEPGHRSAQAFRLWGHSMDAVAFSLLLSVSVWAHHYVLALPVAVWAAATVGRQQPLKVGAAAVLMFCIPTFSVFPLSYHRIAGLLMLVYLTNPAVTVAPGTLTVAGIGLEGSQKG